MKNYKVTKYPQGTFSWADFNTTDMPAAKEFFSKLFGWTSVDVDTGDMSYVMFYSDGEVVAGGTGGTMGEMPPSWSCYVSVDDVDAMAEKVESLGGKVMMPPMDVMTAGRMCAVQDPTGAVLMLWEPKEHIGASVVNREGAMSWNELNTFDAEPSKKFYAELLGWEYDTESMPGYNAILNKGRMNGGIMQLPEEKCEEMKEANIPASWMPYFTVADIDKSVGIVKDNGGIVHMGPFDTGEVGKIAVVAEPSGATFAIIEMSAEPEEWVE